MRCRWCACRHRRTHVGAHDIRRRLLCGGACMLRASIMARVYVDARVLADVVCVCVSVAHMRMRVRCVLQYEYAYG